ncbi:hypothetical protein PAMP_024261 [Pampus punctatissimus]
MAGLCNIKILLLWVGIIVVADCSYTITAIKFGFRINIINAAHGNYTISVKEVNQIETTNKTFQNKNQNQTASFEFPNLKPCTTYDHKLTFNGKETCENNSNKTVTTEEMTEFLQPNETNQTRPTKLPAEIGNLPLKCTNLTIEYICSDSTNITKNLSQLEPFTDYNCTGQIKENNVIIINTTAVRVKVDCEKSGEKGLFTSLYVPDRTTAHENKMHTQDSCNITGLKPYTNYTCEVQPTYKGQDVRQKTEKKVTTKPGVPENISSLSATLEAHNVITLTCKHKEFNGPHGKYTAILYSGVTRLTKHNNNCEFKFKDLSYLTTYEVEVFANNGILSSNKFRKSIHTLYNDKAVIGFMVFLIILMFVALLIVIYILKCRKSQDVNEDIKLNSTAIYANVPQLH